MAEKDQKPFLYNTEARYGQTSYWKADVVYKIKHIFGNINSALLQSFILQAPFQNYCSAFKNEIVVTKWLQLSKIFWQHFGEFWQNRAVHANIFIKSLFGRRWLDVISLLVFHICNMTVIPWAAQELRKCQVVLLSLLEYLFTGGSY